MSSLVQNSIKVGTGSMVMPNIMVETTEERGDRTHAAQRF